MKKILFLFAALAVSALSFAQAPQGINYQGVARNSAGSAISNTVIAVQFQIHQGSTTGAIVFSETHPTVPTDTFGLFTCVVGSVNTSQFSSINWSAGNMYLEIDINGNQIATPQLQSVPYALYAGSAGNSSSSITSITTNTNNITSSGTSTVSLDLATVGSGGTVGSATQIPVITYDVYGRITGATTQTFTSSGGTVTSVTVAAGTPMSIANPNTNPVISMLPANSSTDGYLSQTDWNTFNNKVSSIIAGTGITTTTGTAVTVNAMNTTAMWNASQLQNTPLSITSLASGQVLQYNTLGNWVNATIPLLPGPQQGSFLFTDATNNWAPTNVSNIFTDGTRIGLGTGSNPQAILDIANTNTTSTTPAINIVNNGQGYGINLQNMNTGAGAGGIKVYQGGTTSAAYFSVQNSSANSDALYVETNGGAAANAIKGYSSTAAGGIIGWNDNQSGSGTGSGIYGYSTGNGYAGNFRVQNSSNAVAALIATTTGTTTSSYSGIFSGGQGLQTDKIQITNGAVNGYVLTTDASGNGTWQSAGSGSSAWVLNGNLLYPSNTSYFVGIGTTTPGSALEVQGGNNTAGTFVNSASGLPALSVQNSGTSGYALSVNNNGGGSGASITNTGNAPALVVSANAASGSPSGQFSGGSGLSTDNITNSNSITTANLTVGNNIHISLNANNGYVLTSDATGNGGWMPIPGGVTSVTANSPLVSTGGSAPVISLSNSGVIAQGYGTPTSVPQFTVDAYGRITNASTAAIPGLLPPGANGEMLWNNGGAWQPSNTANLFFNGTKMGVGNSAPIAYLDVATTNTATVDAVKGVNTGTNGYSGNFQTTNSANNNTSFNVNNGGSGIGATISNTFSGNNQVALLATTAGTGNALQAITTGTVGSAGYFSNTAAGNTSPALYAGTNGLGNAGVFQIANASNSNAAINATTNGSGPAINASSIGGAGAPTIGSVNSGTSSSAGSFQVTNAANANPALQVTTSGTGISILGFHSGTAGSAGNFNVSNAANASYALYATTSGTGNAGYFNINNPSNGSQALFVSTNGSGTTVFGQQTGTAGIAGLFQVTNASNASAALASLTNGTGNAASFTINNTANGSNALVTTTNGGGNALQAVNSGTVSSAGLFQITSGGGNAPAIQVSTNAAGNSGVFSGGAGLRTDNFTMTNGAINGALLMSNGAGNAMWSTNTAFGANASTSQPFNATPATVNFPNVNYNNGTGTSTGNSYTPSITGVYHIETGLAVPTSTLTVTYGSMSILVNGTVVKTVDFIFPQYTSGGVNASVTINADVNVPAGQAITIQLSTTPAVSSVATPATNWFNVHLIR